MTIDDALAALTPERFGAWLSVKNDDQIVGESAIANSCPIARYLRDVTGQEMRVSPASVASAGWLWDQGCGPVGFLPEWANAFANAVDEQEFSDVYASEARRILADVLKDLEVQPLVAQIKEKYQ